MDGIVTWYRDTSAGIVSYDILWYRDNPRVSHLPGVTVAPSLSVAVVLILKAHSKMAPALTK